MKTKFTKGDWIAHYDGIQCNGKLIVAKTGRAKTPEQENANLNLIAAAPEMYELLDSIENDAEQVPKWLWDRMQLTLEKARGEK